MSNVTGITPILNRVLVQPLVVVNQTASGIIVSTDGMSEREQLGNTTGKVVAFGNEASVLLEGLINVGDKIIMAKYAGLMYKGKDGKDYRMINHDDITGKLDADMDLVDPHLMRGIK